MPAPVPVAIPVPAPQGIDVASSSFVPQIILNGPINTEADTCPFEPPNSDDTCYGSYAFSWRQGIYAIVGESNIQLDMQLWCRLFTSLCKTWIN